MWCCCTFLFAFSWLVQIFGLCRANWCGIPGLLDADHGHRIRIRCQLVHIFTTGWCDSSTHEPHFAVWPRGGATSFCQWGQDSDDCKSMSAIKSNRYEKITEKIRASVYESIWLLFLWFFYWKKSYFVFLDCKIRNTNTRNRLRQYCRCRVLGGKRSYALGLNISWTNIHILWWVGKSRLAQYLRLLFAISRDWPASHFEMTVPKKCMQCQHGDTCSDTRSLLNERPGRGRGRKLFSTLFEPWPWLRCSQVLFLASSVSGSPAVASSVNLFQSFSE